MIKLDISFDRNANAAPPP